MGFSLAALLDLVDLERPGWYADAACAEHPELNWVPEAGDSISEQLAVCRSCLVRDDCLSAALEHDEVGIWGATSGRQRIRLRRGLPANITSAPAVAPPALPISPVTCSACHGELPAGARRDAVFCSTRCRMAAHRARGQTRHDAPPADGERRVAVA